MACAYAHLEEHQGEHRDFVQRIQELTRQFDANSMPWPRVASDDWCGDWEPHFQ